MISACATAWESSNRPSRQSFGSYGASLGTTSKHPKTPTRSRYFPPCADIFRGFRSLNRSFLIPNGVGGHFVTRNTTLLCSVPLGVLTLTKPVVAPWGTVAVR
jgi:hypothetical protein